MPDPRQQEFPIFDSLDHFAINPFLLTQYFLTFCRIKFGKVEHINDPALKKEKYIWIQDDTVAQTSPGNMRIETAGRFKEFDAMKSPAIIISRENLGVGPRMGIGDKSTPSTQLRGKADTVHEPVFGDDKQTLSFSGSHSFFCVGDTHAESERLGIELFHACADYQSIIRKDLRHGLHAFRVQELGKTGKSPDFKESWVTPFVVSYTYLRSTIIRQESPVLKAFTLADSDGTFQI